jgi:hypothetical protein
MVPAVTVLVGDSTNYDHSNRTSFGCIELARCQRSEELDSFCYGLVRPDRADSIKRIAVVGFFNQVFVGDRWNSRYIDCARSDQETGTFTKILHVERDGRTFSNSNIFDFNPQRSDPWPVARDCIDFSKSIRLLTSLPEAIGDEGVQQEHEQSKHFDTIVELPRLSGRRRACG